MSVVQFIPENARPRMPVARFESDPLNGGQYDFSIAANTNRDYLTLRGMSVYLIDRIGFSAALDEGVWLESCDVPEADFPRISIKKSSSPSTNMYTEPIRALNYWDYGETLLFFRPRAQNETLQISFDGSVNQVAATVGKPTLVAQVSMVIYEIAFSDWTRMFEKMRGKMIVEEIA